MALTIQLNLLFRSEPMNPKQYRRLYNLTYAVLALCAFFVGIGPAQSLMDDTVLEPMRNEARRKGRDLEIKEYNRILATEGAAKAQEFSSMPKVTVMYPARLQFLEDNKKAVSMGALAVVLILFYFVLWLGLRSAVRYVANAPES